MADLALAQHTDAQEYRIPVAVGPGCNHLQTIAGALSLGPQFLAGAAVERYESSAQGLVQGFPVHKAHHQQLPGTCILNDSGLGFPMSASWLSVVPRRHAHRMVMMVMAMGQRSHREHDIRAVALCCQS